MIDVYSFPTVTEAEHYGYTELVDPNHLFLCPEWLRVEEQVAHMTSIHLLAIARPSERPAAALSCFLLDNSSEPWPFTRIDSVLGRLMDKHNIHPGPASLAWLLPTVLCGGHRSSDTRLLTSPYTDAATRKSCIGELLDYVGQLAVSAGAKSITFLYVDEKDRELRNALDARGYLEFTNDPSFILALEEPSFEAYLRKLTPTRRRSVARERSALARAGIMVHTEALNASLIDELAPLQVLHHRKYGQVLEIEDSRRMHRALVNAFGQGVQAFAARSADGVLRGFATMIRRSEVMHMRQVGFDYMWKGRLPIYFEVVFYSPVEFAARNRITCVDYSIASEDVKLSRGCSPSGRYGYIKLLGEAYINELQRLLSRLPKCGTLYITPGEQARRRLPPG